MGQISETKIISQKDFNKLSEDEEAFAYKIQQEKNAEERKKMEEQGWKVSRVGKSLQYTDLEAKPLEDNPDGVW